ncbi:virulence factor TspB C-terminal domain-related protein [Pseudomonas paralcaligenes]|uniref:virulence factor TspB C-terminal domain-related protein n=1 Tax=Pseudomonas paralcaligenes TaxID=2772558 RepID=UPI001C81095F|nr:virulence factor TspB C-terminal domain-related protein [Pseudomonas paralcaligenes]
MPNPDPNDPDPNNPDPNNPDPNNPDPNNPNPGGGNNGGGNNGGNNGGGNGGDDGGGTGGDDGEGGNSGGDNGDDDDSPEASVAGESCDKILKCEGDPIQCAILRQQKESRCLGEKNADYESNKGKIDSLFKGEKFELGESTVEVPGFVQGASRFLPSSCPAPTSFRTSGGTFEMKYEPLCEIASAFSWLFVAAAAFLQPYTWAKPLEVSDAFLLLGNPFSDHGYAVGQDGFEGAWYRRYFVRRHQSDT